MKMNFSWRWQRLASCFLLEVGALAYLQLVDDVLVVPGVAGRNGSRGAGNRFVLRVCPGQSIIGGCGHLLYVRFNLRGNNDGATLSWAQKQEGRQKEINKNTFPAFFVLQLLYGAFFLPTICCQLTFVLCSNTFQCNLWLRVLLYISTIFGLSGVYMWIKVKYFNFGFHFML